MTRASVLLFMLLLAGCRDEKPQTQAVNEMIESPLQNTVISSFDTYPPRPVVRDSESDFTASILEPRAGCSAANSESRVSPRYGLSENRHCTTQLTRPQRDNRIVTIRHGISAGSP
jgi:hypothetical protein